MSGQRVIVVLGMHRSGTSAAAGLLSLLGVDFGKNLAGPQADVNEKGFWEDREIVAIHEALLAHLGSAWDDINTLPDDWWRAPGIEVFRRRIVATLRSEFSASPVWGMKDPRMCRLIPLWFDIFAEIGCDPNFVLIFRHPVEVAASLERRDGLRPETSALLYLQHMLSAEKWTRPFPRVFLRYADLLEHSQGAIRGLRGKLEIGENGTPEANSDEIRSFLSPDLRHHRSEAPASFGPGHWTDPLLEALYGALNDAVAGDTAGFHPVFDRLSRELAQAQSGMDPAATGQIATLLKRLAGLNAHLEAVNANANAQIEYRDKLAAELQARLEAVNANANAQIEYRDKLVAELQAQMSALQSMLRSKKFLLRRLVKECLPGTK